jgi:hypothetical protein
MIPSKVSADRAYQNAKKHSDRRNARIEHDKALKRAMTAVQRAAIPAAGGRVVGMPLGECGKCGHSASGRASTRTAPPSAGGSPSPWEVPAIRLSSDPKRRTGRDDAWGDGGIGLWHEQLTGDALLTGQSLNLDFHSVPYFGEHPVVESHYLAKSPPAQHPHVPRPGCRQPGVLLRQRRHPQGRGD